MVILYWVVCDPLFFLMSKRWEMQHEHQSSATHFCPRKLAKSVCDFRLLCFFFRFVSFVQMAFRKWPIRAEPISKLTPSILNSPIIRFKLNLLLSHFISYVCCGISYYMDQPVKCFSTMSEADKNARLNMHASTLKLKSQLRWNHFLFAMLRLSIYLWNLKCNTC